MALTTCRSEILLLERKRGRTNPVTQNKRERWVETEDSKTRSCVSTERERERDKRVLRVIIDKS